MKKKRSFVRCFFVAFMVFQGVRGDARGPHIVFEQVWDLLVLRDHLITSYLSLSDLARLRQTDLQTHHDLSVSFIKRSRPATARVDMLTGHMLSYLKEQQRVGEVSEADLTVAMWLFVSAMKMRPERCVLLRLPRFGRHEQSRSVDPQLIQSLKFFQTQVPASVRAVVLPRSGEYVGPWRGLQVSEVLDPQHTQSLMRLWAHILKDVQDWQLSLQFESGDAEADIDLDQMALVEVFSRLKKCVADGVTAE